MIRTFTVDPMHCIFQCIMRRLLSFLKGGKLGDGDGGKKRTKGTLTKAIWELIGGLWDAMQLPREFPRKPRSLVYLDKFKATELRTFILYGGEFIFVGYVDQQIFHILRVLAITVRIMADPRIYKEYLDDARDFSKYFIHLSRKWLGDHFVSLSVHMLTHLPDECARNGPLDSFSVFKFENHLKTLKSRLTTNFKNPLATLKTTLRRNATHVSSSHRHGRATGIYLKRQFSPNEYSAIDLPGLFYLSVEHPNCYDGE